MGTPDAIEQVMRCVKNDQKHCTGVVVSAFSGVTDQLIHMAKKASAGDASWHKLYLEMTNRHRDAIDAIIPNTQNNESARKDIQPLTKELESAVWGIQLVKELTPKMLDFVMSFGERLSATILTHCLVDRGIPAVYVDTRSLISTNAAFGSAAVNWSKTIPAISARWRSYRKKNLVPVITGFIGATQNHETTTLGRGGSDYTASIIGAALSVDAIEIWTDVDGVMTADPRKVHAAFTVNTMTYEEMMEMSHFGAKVIYPPTMKPAMEKHIPIIIRNTFHPEFSGTVVGTSSSGKTPIKGISSLSDVAVLQLTGPGMIGVPGIAARLFSALAGRNVNIIMITQASSEHTICFVILPSQVEDAKQAIEEAFRHELHEQTLNPLGIDQNRSIIAIVGDTMRKRPGIAAKLFSALGKSRVNIEAIAQGSSERNISVVVRQSDETKALRIIHKAFFGK